MSSQWIASTQRKSAESAPPEQKTGTRRTINDEDDPSPLILLVDDVEDNRVLYAEALTLAGFRVGHAVDGEHALIKVQGILPDLVVMDLSMPVLDGWEATRLIKEHPRTKHIPVIAVTGHTLDEDVQRARDVGADAVMTRPCPPEALLVVIRKLLARAAQGSS
jgi:CheY-like chemotaxis protein